MFNAIFYEKPLVFIQTGFTQTGIGLVCYERAVFIFMVYRSNFFNIITLRDAFVCPLKFKPDLRHKQGPAEILRRAANFSAGNHLLIYHIFHREH